MSKIIDVLEAKRRFLSGDGVSDKEIKEAEKRLGVKFNSEYVEYLSKYGVGAYSGHELTGITSSDRVNVVAVTLKYRNKIEGTEKFYVIEDTGIEEMIIWQAESGEIFRTVPNAKCKKIADSLSEYIQA